MAAGENVSALGRELGVRRKLLYQWRDTVRRGGVEALRGVGRPPAGERMAAARRRGRGSAVPRGVAVPDELARAQAADRGAGAQDRPAGAGAGFFRASLAAHGARWVERPSGPPDAPASTASSGPGRSGKAG